MIDLVLLAIIAVVTWCLAGDGGWGASLTCVAVILSGLLAMNFFEPVANLLESNVISSYEWSNRWDVISLLGLFAGFVFLFRAATDHLAPDAINMHPLVNNILRWGMGAVTGCVTAAIFLTALHTAPLPRNFWGFKPEPELRSGPLTGMGLDYQWLGFTQRVSEYTFRRGGNARIFDGPLFDPLNPNEIDPNKMKKWPSFPIRYAARREQYASSSGGGGGSTGGGGLQIRGGSDSGGGSSSGGSGGGGTPRPNPGAGGGPGF